MVIELDITIYCTAPIHRQVVLLIIFIFKLIIRGPALCFYFFFQSTVDAEEHLDYSGGNVTLVTDQKNWDNTMEEVAEHGKTVRC